MSAVSLVCASPFVVRNVDLDALRVTTLGLRVFLDLEDPYVRTWAASVTGGTCHSAFTPHTDMNPTGE